MIFDDYGRLLDPRLTLGQVHGGVAQGIGQALFEHALFDAETGQILSGSLMDYALPRADDLPAFEGSLTGDFPSRANRLGVKGSGQAGAIAAPATIMNAVMNALTPLGVRHLDMPATPSRIWHAIRAAGCARPVRDDKRPPRCPDLTSVVSSSALRFLPGSARRNVQRRGLANERLQRLFVDLVALIEIDGAPGVAFEA